MYMYNSVLYAEKVNLKEMLVKDRTLVCSSKKGCFPTLQDLYSTIPRETRIHMQNVGRYADILFRAVYNREKELILSSMGEEFMKYSREVFMMHDIGRHYIPVSILNKVEKLTEEEIQIIKNHTVDVAKAVDSVYKEPYPQSVMEQLLQISLYHHERYDGGGYPLGLKGDEIPLGARICAIADTYDGITAWKPYKRKQTTKEEATQIIVKESGKQFDPMLVNIFLQCVNLF